EARDRVAGHVAGAEQAGAHLVVDGRAQSFDTDGFFIGVSLVDHVVPGMAVYDEEIFGPVLCVVRVSTYEEAVRLVNSNQYANGVALFTRDGRTAREFEVDIEVGMVSAPTAILKT
ncbi:MAG: aldehyde dehydrogenase family protein, partial [Ornithinimicrobium sp.]|uniref:aldehyde dehydrogenase family protein n=1 Tax=Ornithinimicrobium sp. TaxID=1977084 RepID=UPI003D9B1034